MTASDSLPPFGAGRHLLSVQQFDRTSLQKLFDLADLVRPIAERRVVCTVLDGAILGSLFFDARTRWRLSCV